MCVCVRVRAWGLNIQRFFFVLLLVPQGLSSDPSRGRLLSAGDVFIRNVHCAEGWQLRFSVVQPSEVQICVSI